MDLFDLSPGQLAAIGYLLYSIYKRVMRARQSAAEKEPPREADGSSRDATSEHEPPEALRELLARVGIEVPNASEHDHDVDSEEVDEPSDFDDADLDSGVDDEADEEDDEDEDGEFDERWAKRAPAALAGGAAASLERADQEGLDDAEAVYDERDAEHAAHWVTSRREQDFWTQREHQRPLGLADDARTEWRDAVVLSTLLDRGRGGRRK